MTTSPDFADHRIHQTAWRTATLDNAETNGDGYDKLVDVKERITERRRQPPPSTPAGYLHELPALILLDRLPTPILATGLDGVLIYANPAFATMLGRPGTATLTEQPLPALLAGYSATPPRDCVTALRAAAGTVVIDWLHAEGFAVRTVVSNALLLRATDPILLISITDITELMWTLPAVARHARAAPPKRVEPQHIGTHPQHAKTVDAQQRPTDRNPLCQAFPH